MNVRIMMVGAVLLAYPVVSAAQVKAGASADAAARIEVNRGEAGAASATDARTEVAGGEKRAQGMSGGEAALAATTAAKLPEAPVRRIIAEGQARGASAAEIDRAALVVHTRLNAAFGALRSSGDGAAASEAEVVAGAEALASGARPADLAKLRDSAPADRSLAVSLTALAELTAAGMDPARATAALTSQLGAGASDAAIASLGANAVAGLGGLGGTSTLVGSATGSLSAGAAAAGATAGVLGTANLGVLP